MIKVTILEIPLEHREVCNIDETCPTVCPDVQHWYKACEYATFYCTTVSLLPTHQSSTNRVVARNRRIGVGIIDVANWKKDCGVYKVTRHLRKGYEIIRESAARFNGEAGVPAPIRHTTVKPGGTVPKLPGKNPAFYWPNFPYMLRRTRVQENGPIDKVLIASGLPREPDVVSMNTVIYEYPLDLSGLKAASEVSLWEQAMNLMWMQSEWADNAVSNTLYFKPKWPKIKIIQCDFISQIKEYIETDVGKIGLAKDLVEEHRDIYETDEYRLVFKYDKLRLTPHIHANCTLIEIHVHKYDPNHEEDDIEAVLSMVVPKCKSLSLCPHSDKGAYPQMPEEGITKEEYQERLKDLPKIDWSLLNNSDGEDEKYCTSGQCEIAR